MLLFQAGYSFQAAANSTLNVSRVADLRNALARMLCRGAQSKRRSSAVPAHGPRPIQQTSMCPSNRGSGGLPESPSIPWLAGDLLNIMSDNVQQLHGLVPLKHANQFASCRRDCPHAGIQSVNPPTDNYQSRSSFKKRSEYAKPGRANSNHRVACASGERERKIS